jgi:hypothetical protein
VRALASDLRVRSGRGRGLDVSAACDPSADCGDGLGGALGCSSHVRHQRTQLPASPPSAPRADRQCRPGSVARMRSPATTAEAPHELETRAPPRSAIAALLTRWSVDSNCTGSGTAAGGPRLVPSLATRRSRAPGETHLKVVSCSWQATLRRDRMRVGRPRRIRSAKIPQPPREPERFTDPRARMCGTCSCRADQDADKCGQPRVWLPSSAR